MEDTEDRLDDDEIGGEEEDEEEAEPTTPSRDGEEGDVESIQEILAKQEAKAAEEETESLLEMGREERLEPLAVKVVPPQSHEFVCAKCHLVKHRSQLRDKAKMLCRDCA